MADAEFDAVVVGGGLKGLICAMYLTKYGGMSVGIFERRHEIGGGQAFSDSDAPGFIGDPHCTNVNHMYYYAPIQADFPDYEDKGLRLVDHKATIGVITRENPDKCCVIYNMADDPTQEKTAKEITRYAGERDAETYLKMWNYAQKSGFLEAELKTWFIKPKPGEPSALDGWLFEYFKQPDCPIDPEWMYLDDLTAVQALFDSVGLGLMWNRRCLAEATQMVDPGGAISLIHVILTSPGLAAIVGGTHNVAHAYIRFILENGGKFFQFAEVNKILIENGAAVGIRLNDGTEVKARKLVVANVNPRQLCSQLIGEEVLGKYICRKVENMKGGYQGLMWYNWALNEPIKWQAAGFNPDIGNTQNIGLVTEDLSVWAPDYYMRHLGMIPPIEGKILHHAYAAPGAFRAPEGRQTCLTEVLSVSANALSEKQWLEYKKKHAEEVVREWQAYAPDMSWDRIIGYEPSTPYDHANRFINLRPYGDGGSAADPAKPISMRPIREFASHRIANIKNLYGAESSWMLPSGMADVGYTCYKAIAEDFGLRKPWEEQGRPW